MPNISIGRLNELERKERQLKDIEEVQAIYPFVEQFCKNLGIVAASTAFEQWPDSFKRVFKVTVKDFPMAARIYLERLPK